MARNYSAGTASVDISPNFDNFVKKLRAGLKGVDASLEVKVDADTTEMKAKVRAAREEAKKDVKFDVDADTKKAEAKAEALRQKASKDIEVKIKANVDEVKQAFAELGRSSLLNLGAVGVGNLPAAATALASVASSVQQVSQSALLLPGIFAGAGAGISTLVAGMQGFKDALGDDPKKAEAAFNGMSDSAREVVQTLKGANAPLKDLESAVQGRLFEGVGAPLKQVLANDIPALKTGMTGVAGSFNTGIKAALTELGNDKSTSAITTIFGNTAAGADKLNGAIVPIIDSLRRLATTGSKFLPELGQGFTNLATRFDNFITKADESGDLWRSMREGIDSVKTLGSVVGNLGSSLASVLHAAKGDGEGFLTTVDHLTERMANWLKSDEGQAKLKTFFREGREQLEGWKPILESIPGLLKSVYEGSQTWSGVVMPFLRAAAGLLREHGGLVKDVVVAYLAFKTVSPAIDAVRGALTAANGALGAYKKGAAEAAEGGAGKLKSSMGGVQALIGSALGGPWGLAIGAATFGLGILATKHQEAANKAAEQQRALESLGETLDKQSGLATEATRKSTAQYLEKGGYLERAQTLGVNTEDLVSGATGLDSAAKDRINQKLTGIVVEQQRAKPNRQWEDIRAQTGLSDEEIAAALAGVQPAVDKFTAATAGKHTGENRLPDLHELKNNLNDIGESAATLGGQLNGVDSELAKMGESNRRTAAALGTTNVITKEGADAFRAMGIAIEDVTALDGHTVVIKTPTDEQKTQLETLGHIVETLPDGSVKVDLNDEQAKKDIADITKPETKNVTVSVQNPALAYQFLTTPGVTAPGAPAVIPKALGGEITGGTPGVDSVPILGMPGEHMLDTGDVERMGGQAGVYRFRAALKAGLVRGMASGGAVGWTNDDEQQLQQAIEAQRKAEKDQADNLQFKKDLTDDDRRQMQQQVNDARQKVAQLQQQKASGGVTPTTTLPQADLPGYKSDKQIGIENAQIAVDEANTKRNQVYADPNSTANDKRRADNDYLSSQRSLKSAQKAGGDALPEQYTPSGILQAAGGLFAAGALSSLGLGGLATYTRAAGQVVDFYGKRAQEQRGLSDTDTGYTPQNLPVQDQTASQGGLYTGDRGYQAYATGNGNYSGTGGVEQWRSTFSSVLGALGMPQGWIGLGLAQMQTESGGNPKAINLSDSNAAKGTPSKGLMQVIDPTFAAYRSSLYANDIWAPNANIAAALRYMVARYGGPEGVWGQGHGYADGGWITGIGGPRSDSNNIRASVGEFVVNAAASAANGPLLEAINAGIIPAPAPLPQGMGVRGGDSRSVNHDRSINFNGDMHLMDVDHLMREQDRWAGIQSQGALVTH